MNKEVPVQITKFLTQNMPIVDQFIADIERDEERPQDLIVLVLDVTDPAGRILAEMCVEKEVVARKIADAAHMGRSFRPTLATVADRADFQRILDDLDKRMGNDLRSLAHVHVIVLVHNNQMHFYPKAINKRVLN